MKKCYLTKKNRLNNGMHQLMLFFYIEQKYKTILAITLNAPLTLSDPGYFVPLACRRWYKKAHPYYFNN